MSQASHTTRCVRPGLPPLFLLHILSRRTGGLGSWVPYRCAIWELVLGSDCPLGDEAGLQAPLVNSEACLSTLIISLMYLFHENWERRLQALMETINALVQ